MSADNLLHLARASGGVLYLIAALLFVALTIILERYWFLHRLAACSQRSANDVEKLEHLDAAILTRLAEQYRGLPVASVLSAAARFRDSKHRDQLDARLEEAIMREAPRIDRMLWLLDTIVTLAPLLGLLGTIIGMFNAFQVLSNAGNAPTQVTGGVAEALIATASGLFVAMLGLIFFNGLHNRVRGIVHQLETLKVMLVNRLDIDGDAGHSKELRETPRPIVGKIASQGLGR